LKFWICPNCGCVNPEANTKCDGCPLPTLAALVLPSIRWVTFNSYEGLDLWIELAKKTMGAKAWRKKKTIAA
jgi:hypothetical protein